MQRKLIALCWKLCTVCFFVLCMILFVGTVGHSGAVRGVTDTTIKIGTICDLTGPSAGDIGLPLLDALSNYTKHINDSGGVHGRTIKLVFEDDRYSIPAAIAGFKKLFYKDKIFAFVGPGNSGGAKVLYPQMEKLKVPNMAYAPNEFMIKPLKRYVFLPLPLYDDQLGVIYDYIINDLKPENLNLTFVYFDTESGKDALASTKKWSKYLNFDFNTEIVNMGSLDATSQVLSIRRKKTTHIVIHHVSAGAVALLRDLKKFGLNIPVYGTLPTCTENTVKMPGSGSRDYVGVHSFGSWYDDTEGARIMREITLEYKPGTEKPNRSKIYTGAWVVSAIIREGLGKAGKDLTAENMVTAWESIRDMGTGELSGPVNFSSVNHKGISYSKLYRADPESGRLLPITEWRKPPEIK